MPSLLRRERAGGRVTGCLLLILNESTDPARTRRSADLGRASSRTCRNADTGMPRHANPVDRRRNEVRASNNDAHRFQIKTVVGFPGTDGPVNISDEMTISFSRDVGSSRFNGIIDRMRSTVDAVYMSLDTSTPDFGYALKCK